MKTVPIAIANCSLERHSTSHSRQPLGWGGGPSLATVALHSVGTISMVLTISGERGRITGNEGYAAQQRNH